MSVQEAPRTDHKRGTLASLTTGSSTDILSLDGFIDGYFVPRWLAVFFFSFFFSPGLALVWNPQQYLFIIFVRKIIF